MHRTPVKSSNIKSIGLENGILEIEFANGGTVYQYSNVPDTVYQELMSASSKGEYFISQIKDKYECHKLI